MQQLLIKTAEDFVAQKDKIEADGSTMLAKRRKAKVGVEGAPAPIAFNEAEREVQRPVSGDRRAHSARDPMSAAQFKAAAVSRAPAKARRRPFYVRGVSAAERPGGRVIIDLAYMHCSIDCVGASLRLAGARPANAPAYKHGPHNCRCVSPGDRGAPGQPRTWLTSMPR